MPYYKSPVICPICLESVIFSFVRDYSQKKNNFSLYQCSKCKGQFYMPFKSIGLESYESTNSSKIIGTIKPRIYRGYHKEFLKRNKIFVQGTKILDLGCGTGEFLSKLDKRGCYVWGVDFDKSAIGSAKKYFNLNNIYASSFDDFFKRKDLPKFDIVTSFQVLQYLDKPLEFIKNIKKILNPGGKIILSVASRKRMVADFNDWEFPPVTITKWDDASITNLFSKINFQISYICYVEEFKILIEAFNNKTKTGLVNKAIDVSEKVKDGSFFLPKVVYLLGQSKAYLFSFLPAFILWIIGKMTNRKNGTIYLELEDVGGQ